VADDDVFGFALAAEVLLVELAEVHVGLLSDAGTKIRAQHSSAANQLHARVRPQLRRFPIERLQARSPDRQPRPCR
jgi:hypothetical protein